MELPAALLAPLLVAEGALSAIFGRDRRPWSCPSGLNPKRRTADVQCDPSSIEALLAGISSFSLVQKKAGAPSVLLWPVTITWSFMPYIVRLSRLLRESKQNDCSKRASLWHSRYLYIETT